MSGLSQQQPQQPGLLVPGFTKEERMLPHEPCQRAMQAVKTEVSRLSKTNIITPSIEELMNAIFEYLSEDLGLGYGAPGMTPKTVELRFRTVIDKMKICSREQDCVSYLDICKNVHAEFDNRVAEFFGRQDEALLAQANRDKERDKLKQVEWQKWHDYLDAKFAELMNRRDSNGDDVITAGLKKKASMADVLQDEKQTLQQLLDTANATVNEMHRETAAKTSEIRKLQSELEGLSAKDGTPALASHSKHRSPPTSPSSPSRSPLSPRASKEASQKLMEAQKKVLDANKQLNEAEQARREAEQEAEAMRQELADLKGELEQERESLQSQLRGANTRHLVLKQAYDEVEQKLNKSHEANAMLYEQLAEAKGNLRVVTRVRPPLNEPDEEVDAIEMAKGDLVDEIQWLGIPDPKKQTSLQSGQMPPPSWHGAFERVFDTSATNADIFDEVKPVISSAFSGRSVCVFAYGQSGSGKTYTLGTASAAVSHDEGGVIPRSMDMLADFIEKRKDTWVYSVEAEFLEIYNEEVFDLMPEKRTKVAVKYNAQYYFAESRHVELTHEGALDMNMVQSVLQGAADKRKVGATVKNNQSSRSHSLLTLRITGRLLGGTPDGQEQVTRGVLNLVDLAGSEKYTNDAASSTSKEGININNSLMVLRKVIGNMADPKAKHTGYRESTLTKLLEPCLGQGCRVIMLAMVSPLIRDREESRNTLRFAASATEARMQNVRAPDNLSSSGPSAASSAPSSARQSGLPKPKTTPGGPVKPPIGRNGSVQRTPPSLSIPKPLVTKGRSSIASPLSGNTASPRTATSHSLNALRGTNVESATRSRNDLGKQPLPRLERKSSTPPISPASFRERIASAQGSHGNDGNDNAAPPTPTPTSAAGRLPRPPSKLGRSNAVRRPSQAGHIPWPAQ